MRRLVSAVAGLGAGITAGIAAGRAGSSLYAAEGRGDTSERRGAMRATAHSGLPFLVAAIASANRPASRSASNQPGSGSASNRPRPRSEAPWRAGFIGVHLVHAWQIVSLVRSAGTHDPEIRAALALGSPTYALVLAQAALLNDPVKTWAGDRRAGRWSDAIDGQLLRSYSLASLAGLARHRHPSRVYAVIAALLAIGFSARRSPAKPGSRASSLGLWRGSGGP